MRAPLERSEAEPLTRPIDYQPALASLRPGLYPHPPNLAQEGHIDAQRAFWVIKHGIKMSAMPAWGKSFDDSEIWNIVSFVRKMPSMSQETYLRMSQAKVAGNATLDAP